MLILFGLILLFCFWMLGSAIKDVFGRPQQSSNQQPVNVVVHNTITNVSPERQTETNVKQQQEEFEPFSFRR